MRPADPRQKSTLRHQEINMTAFASAIKGLNWTRGMIRLWLLVSIAITGTLFWQGQEDAAEGCKWTRAAEIAWGRDGWRPGVCDDVYLGHAALSALQSGAVSLAILIVGASVVWGVRGFRRTETPTAARR
jgi:hypothetical protein